MGGAVLLIVVLGAASLFLQGRTGRAQQDADNDSSPTPISHAPNGDPVLHIDAGTQARMGLRTQALLPQRWKPELTAYGRLEEDPSRSFTLRAPISGILHHAPGRDWPEVGEHLADGAVIGTIEPRFTPAERIGLGSQLATARSEQEASKASVQAAQAAYERARTLNADNKNVSDQALQDALAHLEGEQARLRAANQTVQQIQEALKSADPAGGRQLRVERGGDVVELVAQPGESIEPGSPILRVAKLDDLLARIDIPVGRHVPPSVTEARIVPAGFEDQSIVAKRIGIASAVDPRVQGEAFLFRLNNSRFGLRPGVAVTAYLTMPGPSETGVMIPQSAVVRLQGLGFAYVKTGGNEFTRRQVALERFTPAGYFTAAHFKPGDRVVIAGAQSLLSEEFKLQIGDTD